MNEAKRLFPGARARTALSVSATSALAQATVAVVVITAVITSASPARAISGHSPVREQVVTSTPVDVSQQRIQRTARTRAAGLTPLQTAVFSRAAYIKQGAKPSLYKGKYYAPKKGETFRRCVLERESKAIYTAANATSTARGAYQFLDSQWRESLVHMMMKEAKAHGLAREVRELRNKPIHRWNRAYQDWAFWRVYNRGEGAKHWHLDGSYCNRLA